MKNFFEAIARFLGFFLFIFLTLTPFVLIPILSMLAPEICGLVGGAITSVAVALWVTSKLVHRSNHYGDKVRTYQDYTEKPMKFLP